MKTQEQLTKMTEQELTFELACLVFGEGSVYMANFGKVGVTSEVYYVDFNDWSWIMPLAVENGVSVEKSPMRKEFISRTCEVNMSNGSFRCCINESPQRAIATCLFLKLQELDK